MKKSTEELFSKYREQYCFVRKNESHLREAVTLLENSYRNGRKLLVCGNGGSCADSDHIVGELVKSFRIHRPLDKDILVALESGGSDAVLLSEKLEGSLPAISLGAHTSLITALINDVGADYIYAQQVVGYGKPGDVLLGISTSGNSKNVLYAGETAKAKGMKTIGMTGYSGGKMRECFDLVICAETDFTEDVQDAHSIIYHILCAALESQFWGD